MAEVSETPANRGGGESQIAKNVEYGERGMKNAARTRERVEQREGEREYIKQKQICRENKGIPFGERIETKQE